MGCMTYSLQITDPSSLSHHGALTIIHFVLEFLYTANVTRFGTTPELTGFKI